MQQTLQSVEQAIDYAQKEGIDCECIVVDNQSSDDSVPMVQKLFPHFQLIANQENTGFSKANNQGIRISKGNYVLLLNPDTVVAEDTFVLCTQFMDVHPKAGALGIKMVDGKGIFLPESKRGLPTPLTSLYKMLGLSQIFYKSKTFNQYHLGYLDKDQNHKVPILSGAFMWMRKSVLDEVGLLDESFFMYGEDIDLSYRIVKAGYDNYYFADSQIIHYKGESTKKGSLNYVRIFYKAMIIFAQKHFAGQQSKAYTFFIQIGIYLRAFLAAFVRLFLKLLPFALDAILIFGGLYAIKEFYANNVKEAASYYAPEYLYVNVPLYILIWLISIYFSGGYDRPYSLKKLVRGILFGVLVIAAVYGFLPEAYRFSRAMILLGGLWTVVALAFWRTLPRLFGSNKTYTDANYSGKLAIVGSLSEGNRIRGLLMDTGLSFDFIGYIDPNDSMDQQHPHFLGTLNSLQEIVELYKIEELIFCSKDMPFKAIIKWMEHIGPHLNYKIVSENSKHIIGSNSKNTAGNKYLSELSFEIAKPAQKRNKRVLDIGLSLLFVFLLPIALFVTPQIGQFAQNCWAVLSGKKTWVGFGDKAIDKLPQIRKSVLTPLDGLPRQDYSEASKMRLLRLYAKEYSVYKDLGILFKNWRSL